MTQLDQAVHYAVRQTGAQASDIPGLWIIPGLPELTTGQLLQVAAQQVAPLTMLKAALPAQEDGEKVGG